MHCNSSFCIYLHYFYLLLSELEYTLLIYHNLFILFIKLLQVKYIVDLQQYIFIHNLPLSLVQEGIVSSRQKEHSVQRHENNGEQPVIGELKYVVQNGLSKTRREMERKRG